MTQAAASEAVKYAGLVDRLAILDLESRYAMTWDLADCDGWAGLFTADGVFELTPAEPPMNRLEGHEALAGFCRTITGIYRGVHVMGAPALTISGDEASG